MQPWKAKNLLGFAAGILGFGLAVSPARAAFTSLYIFGDGVSATTNNTTGPGVYYYGLRYSNGRVWVELLAQQLDLINNYWYSNNSSIHLSYTNLSAFSTNWSYSSNNWSFYGDYSPVLLTNLNYFATPPNASNALFIVWVNDADFVGYLNSFGQPNNSDHGTNLSSWTNAINQSLINHSNIINSLHAKGARTLIMPNAVDITEVPYYNTSPAAYKSFVRQMVISFNTAFAALLNHAKAMLPELTIYEPDTFGLLDNALTNAAAYGLTNALYNGQSIDTVEAYGYGLLPNANLNGPGTNYIFWDPLDPTAKFHAVLADVVKQLIAPAQITNFTALNGNCQMGMASLPIGLNGFVDGTTNLVLGNWTTATNVVSTNAAQTVFFPASGPVWFYRLRFPYAWSWP